jgi:hypothetical protein
MSVRIDKGGKRKNAYVNVHAPDWIDVKGFDRAVGSVDRMKLDAEDQQHLLVVGVDVDNVADVSEGTRGNLDRIGNAGEVLGGEFPDGVIRVRLDENGQLHLAFKLLDVCRVLRLGQGVVVAGDVVDGELVLFEDVLALGGVLEAVVSDEDSSGVVGHGIEEARILETVSKVLDGGR